MTTPSADAVSVAKQWFVFVVDGDVRSAWPLTDPEMRLALVQDWICTADDDDLLDDGEEIAAALAEEQPTHPRWAEFVDVQTSEWRELREGISAMPGGYVNADLAQELVTADLARVFFTPWSTDEIGTPLRVLVRYSDGRWRAAGVGDTMPTSGWPPTLAEVPTD